MKLQIKKMISDEEFEELRKAYQEGRKFVIKYFQGYLFGKTTIFLELEKNKKEVYENGQRR